MGRPKKYGQNMVLKSIYLPEDIAKTIEEIAKENGFSFNEAVVLLLSSYNTAFVDELIKAYNEIRDQMKELKENVRDVTPANLFIKVQGVELPEEIKKDPEFYDAIRRAKTLIAQGHPPNSIMEWLPKEIEQIAIKHGYIVKKKKALRVWVASLLANKPTIRK